MLRHLANKRNRSSNKGSRRSHHKQGRRVRRTTPDRGVYLACCLPMWEKAHAGKTPDIQRQRQYQHQHQHQHRHQSSADGVSVGGGGGKRGPGGIGICQPVIKGRKPRWPSFWDETGGEQSTLVSVEHVPRATYGTGRLAFSSTGPVVLCLWRLTRGTCHGVDSGKDGRQTTAFTKVTMASLLRTNYYTIDSVQTGEAGGGG
ncbi:hypothetical protein BDP67DRAFT_164951 [Colletotrichum lupini]|nr:hypothetical protein BDP67DRAFT_164951 [Colletotrichum lupini]